MTNIERLKLELNGKQYYSDEEYTIFLSENNLIAADSYTVSQHIYILNCVKNVLETLANNLDYFRNISTEFVNTSSAYEYLKDRIDSINQQILQSADSKNVTFNNRKTITYSFRN